MTQSDVGCAGAEVPDAVLLELVDEISRQGQYAESTLEAFAAQLPRFVSFCDSHDEVALPAKQNVVLAFLESQRPGLTWAYAKSQIYTIAASHELAGLPRPDYPLAKKFLQALRRDESVPGPQPLVSPLSESEVESMVTALRSRSLPDSDAGPQVAGLRAALVLARSGAMVRWHDIARETFVQSDSQARSARPAGTDDEARLNRELLRIATGYGTTVLDLVSQHSLSTRWDGAGRRYGIQVKSPDDVRRLSAADYVTLLRICDHAYERTIRDWAYLTVGISGALRHISLANLAIEDLTATDDGFVGLIRYAKLPPGRVLVKDFRHLGNDPATCQDPLCPACALERQLEMCVRRGRSSGPLLATLYEGRWRSMTCVNGQYRMKALYEHLDHKTRGRIATRSLRSTAATWAFREGMTLAEIARHVTDHADVAMCHLYIRVDEARLQVHPRF